GERFDCGSKAGFLKATIAFAMARDDLRDDFGAFLRNSAFGEIAAE
ncbi:MAG: UTP--glucose-1-phosphate uridylyltransferase, partial [Pseudomonadota bacterium]